LLEIADIHAVTKSDLAGASKTLMEIEHAAHMRRQNITTDGEWKPKVIPVNGLDGEGVDELLQAIRDHHDYLLLDDRLQERCRHMLRERIYREALEILTRSFKTTPGKQLADSIERIMRHELTPTQAARDIIEK